MGANKEYFLKLSEEHYIGLGNDEKIYLNHLGMQVKHIANDEDLQDELVISCKKEIAKNYDKIDKYLFEKRNK